MAYYGLDGNLVFISNDKDMKVMLNGRMTKVKLFIKKKEIQFCESEGS